MSTQYVGNLPRTSAPSPWWLLLLVPIAIIAGGLWVIFLRDPTPAIGSQVTMSAPNLVCTDQLALGDSVEASIQQNQARISVLVSSGRCWLQSAGTQARVEARGQVSAAGQTGPSVELRILSGPQSGKDGWAYVPPSGL